MQFTRVNSNPDETNGLLGVIDKVGLIYYFLSGFCFIERNLSFKHFHIFFSEVL